jgi:starch phosphorylase
MSDKHRTGLAAEDLKQAFIDSLIYDQARQPGRATLLDHYLAAATAIRDRLTQRWISTMQTYVAQDVRIVCYLSAEFLLGPHLGNNLLNLGIESQAYQAMEELKLDAQAILNEEPEPGLGNGGLGRLAACYMDSLSTLQIPAIGFGIRYEYGIFDQLIRDGWQVEVTDKWLQWGNPWEIARPEGAVNVSFGGRTEAYFDELGKYRVRWIPGNTVKAIPYDTPIVGYLTNNVNTLRLWKAEAVESFNFNAFNVGDYVGSVREKMLSENISKVLYPNDDNMSGKELRLEQQYFFVAASLKSIINIHLRHGRPLDQFHAKWAIQMNDTHPSIGVAELMRLLVDEHGLAWEAAWETTVKTLGYTNHTLLPEALERWPLPLFKSLLPRHLEITFEINRRFLDDVKVKFPHDDGRIRRISLIDETGERFIRMAHLATVGSHAINGVAELHSELLRNDLLNDLYQMYPERFSNKTNGVTPRRWLALANPALAQLITKNIGDGWISNLDHLRKLEDHIEDPGFRESWSQTQHAVKQRLVDYIHDKTGIAVDPTSMFDTMVKRIHEYKRQHLKVLHIVTLYNRIKKNPSAHVVPRTFLFGGKAAPGYFMAKLIIKLINSVAEVVNVDSDVAGRLRAVFLPDYNVTFGQRVYPAADLSEQISLAGKEASGTGNMKFALNGALTVGTLDGANIEIREAVGAENFFIFGLTTDQVYAKKSEGYKPRAFYESNAELKQTLDELSSGRFSRGDTSLFRPILDTLLYRDDPYMLLADYQSYIECQDKISQAYLDQDRWTRMSILNTARMSKFSSDRAIREYCNEIWNAKPVKVELAGA